MNDTKPLTGAEANEIGGAIQELVTLTTKTIIEKDDAARKRALSGFIQEKLMLHCQELLSAWFVVEREYKPFLSAQASVMGNVFRIIETRNQIAKAQEQPQPEEKGAAAPENVVELNANK